MNYAYATTNLKMSTVTGENITVEVKQAKVNNIKNAVLLVDSVLKTKTQREVSELLDAETKKYVTDMINQIKNASDKDRKLKDLSKLSYSEQVKEIIFKMNKINEINFINTTKVKKVIDKDDVNKHITKINEALNAILKEKKDGNLTTDAQLRPLSAKIKALVSKEDKVIIDTYIKDEAVREAKRLSLLQEKGKVDERKVKNFDTKFDRDLHITKTALNKHYKQAFDAKTFSTLAEFTNYVLYSILVNAFDSALLNTPANKKTKMVKLDDFVNYSLLDKDPLSTFYVNTKTFSKLKSSLTEEPVSTEETEEVVEEEGPIDVEVEHVTVKFSTATKNIKKILLNSDKYASVKTPASFISFCDELVTEVLHKLSSFVKLLTNESAPKKKITVAQVVQLLNVLFVHTNSDTSVEKLVATPFKTFLLEQVKH